MLRGFATVNFFADPTASVVDPFGNVLGLRYNPHYAGILERVRPDMAGLDELKA